MCDRVYVLYAGSVLEVAPAAELELSPAPSLLARAAPLGAAGRAPARPPRRPSRATSRRPTTVATACRLRRPLRLGGIRVHRGPAAARGSRAAQVRAPACGSTRFGTSCARPGRPPPRSRRRSPSAPPRASRSSGFAICRKSFGPTKALANASIEVFPGESVGLVGESGSGKIDARALPPRPRTAVRRNDRDRGRRRDRPAAARRRRAAPVRSTVQIVFQDPYSSLNPARTVERDPSRGARPSPPPAEPSPSCSSWSGCRPPLPAASLRRSRAGSASASRSLARSRSGRRLLVCDEPVSALDVSIQAQILNLFRELREELGIAYLFITHDLAVVRQVVERIYVLYRGTIVETGSVDQVLDHPARRLHPPVGRVGSLGRAGLADGMTPRARSCVR